MKPSPSSNTGVSLKALIHSAWIFWSEGPHNAVIGMVANRHNQGTKLYVDIAI